MKRTILSARDAAWLSETFARNAGLFGGWHMEDPPEGGSGADGGQQGADGDQGKQGAATDGFPASTRPEDMTVAQQAAYYRHYARKHEERNKSLLAITGGRYGDDLKGVFSELETLRTANQTDQEKAVTEAQQRGASTALAQATPKFVSALFDMALADVPSADRAELIDTLDLTKFVREDGSVDTDKVRTVASRIAPAGKGAGSSGRHDFGAGRRQDGTSRPGSAGISEAERRFGKPEAATR